MSVQTVWVLVFTADYDTHVTLHNTYDLAKSELYKIVDENWDSDWAGANFEDIEPDQAVEIYFDAMDDQSWYIQKKTVELGGEDLYLTPGMCSIIKKALSAFSYEKAGKILQEHGEAEEGTIIGAGSSVVDELIDSI